MMASQEKEHKFVYVRLIFQFPAFIQWNQNWYWNEPIFVKKSHLVKMNNINWVMPDFDIESANVCQKQPFGNTF